MRRSLVSGRLLALAFLCLSYASVVCAQSVTVSVFASGLTSPRGLKFGPDGHLYVAEAGYPSGTLTKATAGLGGDCSAGLTGPGDYYGSTTGSRISRIDAHGNVTTFVDNLPSSEASGLASGVADVAFIGDTLYAIFAGAGCSHGVPSVPNAVIRVNRDRSWTIVANLAAYQQAHPVANPTDPITGDFEPDGTWYSMIALRGSLYAVEPNHGELDEITTKGKISRIIDISASQGHVVPTAIADTEQHRDHGERCEFSRGGVFYVGNLGQFAPAQLNTQSVFRVTESGSLQVVATGFSKVLGVAIDGRDRLYVLDSSYSTTDPGPEPFTGRLIRVSPNGKQEILIDSTSGSLVFPTGMTFGPDGNLYVSNYGFGFPEGAGQIVKVTLHHGPED